MQLHRENTRRRVITENAAFYREMCSEIRRRRLLGTYVFLIKAFQRSGSKTQRLTRGPCGSLPWLYAVIFSVTAIGLVEARPPDAARAARERPWFLQRILLVHGSQCS